MHTTTEPSTASVATTAATPPAFLFDLRFHFFTAGGAAFGIGESFRFKELLFAHVENELVLTIDANQRTVARLAFG